jgi:hypothetical protein
MVVTAFLSVGTVAVAQEKGGKVEAPREATPSRCAPALRNGCEGQQASCRLACPPQFSTNPSAPAFTLNDRAGCTQQCFSRYLSCLRLYGC